MVNEVKKCESFGSDIADFPVKLNLTGIFLTGFWGAGIFEAGLTSLVPSVYVM